MKKSIQYVANSLVGITVTCFLVFGTSFAANKSGKPEGKPWPCPEKFTKMENPIKPEEGILAAGKVVWDQNCKSCHGKYGKGDGVRAKNIDITCGDFTNENYQKMSDGEIYWKITNGRKPMPYHKEKLSNLERWSVIHYIRTFPGKNETRLSATEQTLYK